MLIEEIIQIVEDGYLEIFERPADRTGLDHYVGRMMNSNDPLNTKEELIALFMSSDEYTVIEQNEKTPCTTVNDNIMSLNTKVDRIISKLTCGYIDTRDEDLYTLPDFSSQQDGLLGLIEIDKLTVHTIIDNNTDLISNGCDLVKDKTSGISYTMEGKKIVGNNGLIDFSKSSAGAHGYSLLLVAEKDGVEHTILFDGGPSQTIFSENIEKRPDLDSKITNTERILVSHYHQDHTEGLRGAIPYIANKRSEAGLSNVIVDLHPDIPLANKTKPVFGPTLMTFKEVEDLSHVSVEISNAAHTICDNYFFVSGYINKLTDYEKGMGNHQRAWTKNESGALQYIKDGTFKEERYIACNIKGGGLIVFSACSHAGIVNVCMDVLSRAGNTDALPNNTTNPAKLFSIFGGLHLPGTGENTIRTINDLSLLNPYSIFAGHCTGWESGSKLYNKFPTSYQPTVVGGTYVFTTPDN